MNKLLYIFALSFSVFFLNAQTVVFPELDFYPGADFYYDDLSLGSDEFFIVPIYLDTYIDLNEFSFNLKYNHNVVEPLINNLDQINDDSYISNIISSSGIPIDLSISNGGFISCVTNTINSSESLLSLNFTSSSLTSFRYNLCNGRLIYLAFKKLNACYKGPLYFQFSNGEVNGSFVNPSQTSGFEIIGSSTYSTEMSSLIVVNGDVLFDFPQSNILINGSILEASVFGGTPPYIYEWSDKLGNVLGTNIDYTPIDTGMVILSLFDANGCMSVTSYNFYFTDISFSEKLYINTYPNPVDDKLYIYTNQNFYFEIIDLNGNHMFEGSVNGFINVKDLRSGIYLLKLYNNLEYIIKRIIIR